MFARKRFDLDATVLARALAWCVQAPSEARSRARIAGAWGRADEAVAGSSVRSLFDLLLSSVSWPPGAEVVMSAVTIPHMALLVRLHGFTPVAVDVDPVTFALDAGAVERALTARTVAVVTAHLFGARNDTAALARVTQERGLLLIEDCAQCFDGRPRARGKADVELYSFGSIKTATCLGGAVALVGEATLRAAIEERGARQPVQSTSSFALKVLKYVLLVGISGPRAFMLFSRVARDYDALLRRLTRGYDEAELLPRLRQRPSRALLALLAYRLHTYDPARVQARRAAGERVAAKLAALGGGGAQHTHWLFPVVSSDVVGLVARLRAAGFDATNGASTLVAIDASAVHATEVMAQVVYLPVYDEMPTEALDELGRLVEEHERGVEPSPRARLPMAPGLP